MKRPVNDRNAVRLHIGMVSGFTPEPRPASSRKPVRIASESTVRDMARLNAMAWEFGVARGIGSVTVAMLVAFERTPI
jgi:hypothetical protein